MPQRKSPMVSILQPETKTIYRQAITVQFDAEGDIEIRAKHTHQNRANGGDSIHLDREGAEQLLAAIDLILGDN